MEFVFFSWSVFSLHSPTNEVYRVRERGDLRTTGAVGDLMRKTRARGRTLPGQIDQIPGFREKPPENKSVEFAGKTVHRRTDSPRSVRRVCRSFSSSTPKFRQQRILHPSRRRPGRLSSITRPRGGGGPGLPARGAGSEREQLFTTSKGTVANPNCVAIPLCVALKLSPRHCEGEASRGRDLPIAWQGRLD